MQVSFVGGGGGALLFKKWSTPWWIHFVHIYENGFEMHELISYRIDLFLQMLYEAFCSQCIKFLNAKTKKKRCNLWRFPTVKIHAREVCRYTILREWWWPWKTLVIKITLSRKNTWCNRKPLSHVKRRELKRFIEHMKHSSDSSSCMVVQKMPFFYCTVYNRHD